MKEMVRESLALLNSKKLLQKLEGALIGGSWARGEATKDSDIDLLLIFKNSDFDKFEKLHSQEVKFKDCDFSLIFQSRRSILTYIRNPDPSVISFLREGIILYDPKGKLSLWTKKAKKLKIFDNATQEKESKRRLKERVEYNARKIKAALNKGDGLLATYLLRGIVDEVVEKQRMYDGDWLYSQKKSAIKFLGRNKTEISKLFRLSNPTINPKVIKQCLGILEKLD